MRIARAAGPAVAAAFAMGVDLCRRAGDPALLLAVFGLESLTWSLGLGALVIVAAGLLSRSD
jgi:hypothetical protein